MDLATFAACGLVVASILVTRVARYRAAARGVTCSNNLKQLGLGLHNYHAAYKRLPMGSGGTSPGSVDDPLAGNASRLSAFVGVIPFVEQQRLWEQIANPLRGDGVVYPPMGPVPWYDPDEYTPWGQRPALFVCPSDMEDAERFPTVASYTVNYGDGIYRVGFPSAQERKDDLDFDHKAVARENATRRGVFMRATALRFRDILDGTSNTLFFSESRIGGPKVAKNVEGLALNPSRCIAARENKKTEYWPEGREACWADGSLLSTGFQTVLPPNSPSATSPKGRLEGVMSVSSLHADGAHVLFADGRVLFVSNEIDSGDSTKPSVASVDGENPFAAAGSPSPYGLWGALGTRASKETVDLKNENIMEPPVELTDQEIAEFKSKPLQNWKTADGETEFEARQVDLENRSRVILLGEDGKVRRMALSSLASEDAFRAVEQHLKAAAAWRETLVRDLERAVKLLEQKKFNEFAADFFGKKPDQRVLDVIAKQRGILIYQFEAALDAIASDAPNVVQENESGDQVRIRVDVVTRGGNLTLQRSGDRWRITQ